MKLFEFINNFQYANDGIGKNTPINDVNINELLVGIGVEMEHTKDLNISASIAVDHLTENEKYYSILIKSGLVDEEKAILLGKKYLNVGEDDPEISAQINAANDAVENSKESEDDKMTDILLGYQPKNVGDEIEGINSEPETDDEEYYEPEEDVNEIYESKEDEIKRNDPATWHQIQIAKKTIRMPSAMAGVMGGMSKEEAKAILDKRGIKYSEN